MNITTKLTQAYFNYVYNVVYDFGVAKLNIYRKLQGRCISKLGLRDNDKILCVGLGTGNEIFHLLQINRNISITGVDYSSTAMRNARRKALRLGKEIELLLMDARCLEFATESFDKVLCLHVMDFVQDNESATCEIVRVLKEGGQFVITYPSEKEGSKLATSILKDSFHSNTSSRNYIIGLLAFVAQMLTGLVYLPLLFRPKGKAYSRNQLEAMISQLTTGVFQIEEDPIYQDFIVYGEK